MLQPPGADPMLVTDRVDNPAEFAERAVHPTVDVIRTLRDDPVGHMLARKQIEPWQERAARLFQRTWEAAGPRMRSSGHLEEPVDGGGKMPAGITDQQLNARDLLQAYRRELGSELGWRVVVAVLIDKCEIWGVVDRFNSGGSPGEARKFYGRLFRECLTVLARAMGLAA